MREIVAEGLFEKYGDDTTETLTLPNGQEMSYQKLYKKLDIKLKRMVSKLSYETGAKLSLTILKQVLCGETDDSLTAPMRSWRGSNHLYKSILS